MIKIYIASSWKNKEFLISFSNTLNSILTTKGKKIFNVDCFCNPVNNRFVFSFDKIDNVDKYDMESILDLKIVQKAFKEDKKFLDWCDMILLILPSGNSAHLEAGYVVGKGKPLFIYNFKHFEKGKFDVMYQFAYGVYERFSYLYNSIIEYFGVDI